jgi:hypothetical protein
VFAAAIEWLEGTLLGTVATTIAIVAVASIGFLLMTGRINVRRASQVVFGCFILFGASTIASGIMNAVSGTVEMPEAAASPSQPPAYPTVAPAQSVKAIPYDPYAGAAMPPRPQ